MNGSRYAKNVAFALIQLLHIDGRLAFGSKCGLCRLLGLVLLMLRVAWLDLIPPKSTKLRRGASLADIAQASSIAKGTLYYYYPAKDELIEDVARTYGDYMGDTLLEWAESLQRETDAGDAMRLLLNTLMADDMHRRLHVVLCAQCAIEDSALAGLIAAMEKKWALMLEVGSLKLRSNQARTIRARSAAFFSMLMGYMAKSDITKDDIEEFISIFLS